jgi:hypothetical protein
MCCFPVYIGWPCSWLASPGVKHQTRDMGSIHYVHVIQDMNRYSSNVERDSQGQGRRSSNTWICMASLFHPCTVYVLAHANCTHMTLIAWIHEHVHIQKGMVHGLVLWPLIEAWTHVQAISRFPPDRCRCVYLCIPWSRRHLLAPCVFWNTSEWTSWHHTARSCLLYIIQYT